MARLKPGYTVNEAGEVVGAGLVPALALVATSPFLATPALVADVAAALTEEAQIERVGSEPRSCNACGGALHPDRERCLACQVRYGAVSHTEYRLAEATDLETLTTAEEQVQEAIECEQEVIRRQMLVPLEEQLTPGEQRAKKALEGDYLPPPQIRLMVDPAPMIEEMKRYSFAAETPATIEGELVHRAVSVDALIDTVLDGAPQEPVKGRRAKERKLVSVTTALLPADKERLQVYAEQHGMKIGPYVRSLLEICLVVSSEA